jgi:hypothetical protein
MAISRWNRTKGDFYENEKVDAFLNEVIELSKKHGLSISHEDGQGAFIVKEFDDYSAGWLMNAFDDTKIL